MGYLNCLKLINKAAGRKLSDAEHTALQERFNDAVKQLEPTVKDKAALYKQAAELAASKLKQDAMDYQATAHKYLAGHEMVKSGSLLQTANPFDRGVQPSSYKNEVNSSSAVWTSIPDKVTQVFKDLGFDGIIDESGKGGGNKHTVYIPFEENQVKSAIGNKGTFGDTSNILKQGAKGSYSPSRNLIQLYKTADVTTVVHESAHQYFDTYAKIALDPNAPATIKADTDTILHFLGVDSLSDWHTMSLEEQRPYHEKLATTFERYMMEDKAPSALMNVFTKIKTWMLETYKSLTDVGVEPTPELREVFDKWSGQDIIPDRFKMGDFTPVEAPRVASEVVDDPYVSEANRIVEEVPDMKIPLADINGNPLMDENGEPRMVSAKDHLEELHADRVASETNDAKFVTAALQCILGAA